MAALACCSLRKSVQATQIGVLPYIRMYDIAGEKCRVWYVAAEEVTTALSSLPLPTLVLPTPGGKCNKRVRLPQFTRRSIARGNLLVPR